MDIIRKLGPLAFASRLKRISERLMRDVSRIYQDMDAEFQARWFPVMFLLAQKSPLSVTGIARELGMTHPAINQIAAGMTRAGLLNSTKDDKDDRKRMLSISPAGGKVLVALTPIWKDIEAATREMLDDAGQDLMTILDNIEQSLDERDMYERVTARMNKRRSNGVEIVEYAPKYKPYFKTLNLEWLEKYFSVEDQDRKMLDNPGREILKKGGFIFFARKGSRVIGTAALLRRDADTFELAKMAVAEKDQRLGAGEKLAQAVIDKARKEGAGALLLHTNRRLEDAFRLYQKLGFIEIEDAPQPPEYLRPTITMKMVLKK